MFSPRVTNDCVGWPFLQRFLVGPHWQIETAKIRNGATVNGEKRRKRYWRPVAVLESHPHPGPCTTARARHTSSAGNSVDMPIEQQKTRMAT